jgi:glycosyltransferase involved in cell wall biosynthesis
MPNYNINISVIICTYNHPEKVTTLIKSLLASSYRKNFEIIIIEQLGSGELENNIRRLDNRIKYFNLQQKGLNQARNFGISKAKGKIIAFTDDDCLVNKKWLIEIEHSFNDKSYVGIFGNFLPYKKSERKNYICPSTIKLETAQIINKPLEHWKIGSGGNMAFRKNIFSEIGCFANILGQGAVGGGGDDVEFIFRLLVNHKTLFFNPKMLVYHDKWLTKRENEELKLKYLSGNIACYLGLYLSGYKIGLKVMMSLIKDNWKSNNSHHFNNLVNKFKVITIIIKGVLLGIYILINNMRNN